MTENINPSEKIQKILMSHPAKNCFLISNFPYLNTIWNTTIAIVVFTLFLYIHQESVTKLTALHKLY